MRFQQADFDIQRTTFLHTAARESLPKCFQLFQTAIGFPKISRSPMNVDLSSSTEAGYMTILDGCPPLKCVFFSFFWKSAFFLHWPWPLYHENEGFQLFFKTASRPAINRMIADIGDKCESIHQSTMLFCEKALCRQSESTRFGAWFNRRLQIIRLRRSIYPFASREQWHR